MNTSYRTGDGRSHATFAEAVQHASKVFNFTGKVVGVESERPIERLERGHRLIFGPGCEICGGKFIGGIFCNAADEIVCLKCFRAFIPTAGANLPRCPSEVPYA